jgi:hypothetical protein
MQQVSTFFKEETDFMFKRGEKVGEEKAYQKAHKKAKTIVVKNLLDANRFTVSEIANYAGVSEDFVREVQKEYKNL